MLNWIAIWIGTYFFGLQGPFVSSQFSPISNDIVRNVHLPGLLGRPGAAGPPHRLLHRDRRARRLLGDPQPHDARLRGPRGRLQPRGGPLQRDQRQAQLLPRDGDLRRRSPASPARSTSSAGSSTSRRPTSSSRTSASSGSRSRCSAATAPSASSSRRCSSARSRSAPRAASSTRASSTRSSPATSR